MFSHFFLSFIIYFGVILNEINAEGFGTAGLESGTACFHAGAAELAEAGLSAGGGYWLFKDAARAADASTVAGGTERAGGMLTGASCYRCRKCDENAACTPHSWMEAMLLQCSAAAKGVSSAQCGSTIRAGIYPAGKGNPGALRQASAAGRGRTGRGRR